MVLSRITILFFAVLFLHTAKVNAQVQQAQFEIGNKTIQFTIEEKLSVWRTVSDSVIKCKGDGVKNFLLEPHTEYRVIPTTEFKTLHREIFNEHGCIWTRLTNDVIRKDDDGEGVRNYCGFLFDSVNIVLNPVGGWRHDSVMQINPITLEEEMIVVIDSESRVKFNLGNIRRQEIVECVRNQFGLRRSTLNFHIQDLQLYILNEKFDWLEIDYRQAESIELAEKKIRSIKSGSKIILENIRLENTNGRNFAGGLYDIAVMTLVD